MPVNTESFDQVASVEPMTKDKLRMIAGHLGMIQSMVLKLGEVDLAAGAGIINRTSKCLWTKSGHRITFDAGFGGFIGSISNTPDPSKPLPPRSERP